MMTDPTEMRRNFWLKAIWFSIAGILLPPLLGLALTVWGMITAFRDVAASGASDAESLASGMSLALVTTTVGVLISAIACIFLIVALVRFLSLPKSRAIDG